MKRSARNTPQERPPSSRGFTLIELMIVVAVIAIVAAIAIPSLQNARKSANEGSAIGSLRTVFSALEQYRTRFGAYAPSLIELHDAGYLPAFKRDAGEVKKSGYIYRRILLTNVWAVRANPEAPGVTGDRYFSIGSNGVIRWSSTGPVTMTSPPLE